MGNKPYATFVEHSRIPLLRTSKLDSRTKQGKRLAKQSNYLRLTPFTCWIREFPRAQLPNLCAGPEDKFIQKTVLSMILQS